LAIKRYSARRCSRGDPISYLRCSRIENTCAILSQLVSRRETEISRKNFLCRAVFALKNIPPEILREVFAQCCVAKGVYIPPNLRDCPWTLGHVCSLWRQVLWKTSKVWSNIFMGITITSRSKEIAFETLKHIITTSNALLSTSFTTRSPAIADIVLRFLGHFRRLHIDANQEVLAALLALPSGSFNSLESLILSTLHSNTVSPGDTSSLLTAHNLRELNLHTYKYTFHSPLLLAFPLTQLHTMEIIHMPIPPQTVYVILQGYKALVRCHLIVGSPTSEPVLGFESISLPDLRLPTLYRQAGEHIDPDDFLTPFTLPSLQSLSLITLFKPFTTAEVPDLVRRSGCNLTELCVYPPTPL
jgi:hypothetical protein